MTHDLEDHPSESASSTHESRTRVWAIDPVITASHPNRLVGVARSESLRVLKSSTNEPVEPMSAPLRRPRRVGSGHESSERALPYPSIQRRPSTQHPAHQSSISSDDNSPSTSDTKKSASEISNKLYRLDVVQHPVQTAAFESSTLNRLPLLPPLIVQLNIGDNSSAGCTDHLELPFLVAQLSLFTGDGKAPLDVATAVSGQSPPERLLYGGLVSSAHVLRNLRGAQGVYFFFPDVSVRWRGQFQLGVTLIGLPKPDMVCIDKTSVQSSILTHTRSLPFDVLPRANYVAPTQTPLTQYFIQQGAQMLACRPQRSAQGETSEGTTFEEA